MGVSPLRLIVIGSSLLFVLSASVVPAAKLVPATSASGSDVVALGTGFPEEGRPLLTVVRVVGRDGRVSPLCTVLGQARVRGLPVAGQVLVGTQPLGVGSDEDDIPDTGGAPVVAKTMWFVPHQGGEARAMPAQGVLSPSGDRYAFWGAGPEQGPMVLWLQSGGGTVSTGLSPGSSWWLEWSPDGQCLAANGYRQPSSWRELLTVVETERLETVFEARHVRFGCWSADGQELAFFANVPSPPELKVWNRQSGRVEAIAQLPKSRDPGEVHWSPDGKQMLYVWSRWEKHEHAGDTLVLVERETKESRQVYVGEGLALLGSTRAGDAWWVHDVAQGRLLLLDLDEEAARMLVEVATEAPALRQEPLGADVAAASQQVREGLACVARAKQAATSYCEDLAGAQAEMLRAEQILRALPEACPRAGLLLAQCKQYAEALAEHHEQLPVAACEARMERLAWQLVEHYLQHGLLPPDAPTGFQRDLRYWVSPGATTDAKHRIRYRIAAGGTPRPGQVVLECGPIGDKMVRWRWPERVTGPGPSRPYTHVPPPTVEPAEE